MPIDVMQRTNGRPLVTSLSVRQWRAALRADFGIRLPTTAARETLYVAWCEAWQAAASPHYQPPLHPQPEERADD